MAKSAGFCFGVKRALDIAFKTAKSSNRVYMLGDIVHNEDAIKEIEKAGIKKITRLTKGENNILLLRAHGAGAKTIETANRLGYKIVDATCPMVKEIHKIAKDMEQKGYKIIIIGDKRHDEVQGIIGQLKSKAIIIDGLENISFEKMKRIKKAAVLSQSTQDLRIVLKIANILKQHINELKFFNTICLPTRMKQQEIKTLTKENEVVIIIGSRTSANTRRLFEIAKALNARTYWIQSGKEINPIWFKHTQSVGITAGASTPEWITRGVIEYIKKL